MIKKIEIHTIIDRNGNTHTVAAVYNGFWRFMDKLLTVLLFCLIPALFWINKQYIQSLVFDLGIFCFSIFWFFALAKTEKREISKEDLINSIIKMTE